MLYSPNRRFSVLQQVGAFALHVLRIDLRDDELFFLLTSCSHLPEDKPALSKESIESNHVNTLLKSSLRSHFCTYYLGLFLQNNTYKFSRTDSKKGMDQHRVHIFGQSTEIKRVNNERDS